MEVDIFTRQMSSEVHQMQETFNQKMTTVQYSDQQLN